MLPEKETRREIKEGVISFFSILCLLILLVLLVLKISILISLAKDRIISLIIK
jgi:hypothetical protein